MQTTRLYLFGLFLLSMLWFPHQTLALAEDYSERSAVQFRLDSLEYQEFNNLRFAAAFIYWGNTSQYELYDLAATIDLYNKDGQIISEYPMVIEETTMAPRNGPLGHGEAFQFELVKGITKASDLDGAYIKPELIFGIGKKAIPESIVQTKVESAHYQENRLHVETIIFNAGEATAKHFDWHGVGVVWPGEEHAVSYEKERGERHPVVNDSLVLEPGHFVRASFDLPFKGRAFPLPDTEELFDALYMDVHAEYEDSTPYLDSSLQIYVNNKRLTSNAVIENGISYVPLRDFAESIGATVSWDEPTESVIVRKGDTTIRTSVGSTKYMWNEKVVREGEPAKLHNNTTYIVPLRLVAEMLECRILYKQIWEKEVILVIPKGK